MPHSALCTGGIVGKRTMGIPVLTEPLISEERRKLNKKLPMRWITKVEADSLVGGHRREQQRKKNKVDDLGKAEVF